MIDPPHWTSDQLKAHAAVSIEQFRKQRIEEPLEHYLEAFDDYHGHVEDLFKTTLDLTKLESSAVEIALSRRKRSASSAGGRKS